MFDARTTFGQKYGFACGRTAVLRQILLLQSDIDRMVGSQDAAEFDRVLTETKLTSIIPQGIAEAVGMLPALEQWLKEEVAKMAPSHQKELFNAIWIDGDAPLLAWLFKKKYGLTNEQSQEPKTGIRAFTDEALTALVEKGAAGTLPYEIARVARDIETHQTKKAEEIDTLVAAAAAKYKVRLAKESGSEKILSFIQHSIDVINARTALRRKEGDDAAFLPGGSADFSDARSFADVKAKLATVDFSGHLEQAKTESVTSIEQSLFACLADEIAAMWGLPMTVEQVFAFAVTANSHISLVRAVHIGKRAALSPQDIKSMLPPFVPAGYSKS